MKEKCGISDAAYDSTIDALILEVVPVVEYRVRAEHVASSEAGLVATLALAATELVAGELLAQLSRGPGWSDRIRLGELELAPGIGRDLKDPSGLLAQGEARLLPFLKERGVYRGSSVVASPIEGEVV